MACFVITSHQEDGSLEGRLCRGKGNSCRYCRRTACYGEITFPEQIIRELPEQVLGFRYFVFELPPNTWGDWVGNAVRVPEEFIPPPQPIPTLEEWEKAGRPE